MHIVYLPGNQATTSSLNSIRSRLQGYRETSLEYNSLNGFYRNHDAMFARLSKHEDIFFVAHSLGGIHALHLSHHLGKRVRGGITLSTPYGGSELASMLRLVFPFNQLASDISPEGRPILEAARMRFPRFWTNIVTVGGSSPLLPTPNDGVVSQNSMRHRKDIRLIDSPCGHFEVVSNACTVRLVCDAVRDAKFH
jgi:pimeloyl-ACP methyl ester carboxylesterase